MRNKLKSSQRLHIVTSIVGAVAFLHEQRVMHRDSKPDNVFLTQPVTVGETRLVLPPVVLGDFGYARTIPDMAALRSCVTTGHPASYVRQRC